MMDESADQRCRLCTSNDLDAFAEEIAAEMWVSYGGDRRDPWEGAGEYWHGRFIAHAKAMIRIAQRGHGHGE